MDYENHLNGNNFTIDIDPLKINNEIFNDENKFKEIFLNTFKKPINHNDDDNKNLNDLKEKLLYEMPENIKKLIQRYEGVKFTKKMFDDYFKKIKSKSINNNIEENEIEIKIEQTNDKNEINTESKNNKKNSSGKKLIFSTIITK
jgi:hypothetical protein